VGTAADRAGEPDRRRRHPAPNLGGADAGVHAAHPPADDRTAPHPHHPRLGDADADADGDGDGLGDADRAVVDRDHEPVGVPESDRLLDRAGSARAVAPGARCRRYWARCRGRSWARGAMDAGDGDDDG
jgi:hypothetical protein